MDVTAMLYKELEMQADIMQAASSMGDPVGPDWLDRRIRRIRAILKTADKETNRG